MKLAGIALRLRKWYIRATAGLRRKAIDSGTFTILSNNCWGGLVYESYDLPKQSPTVGLYFMAEEYLKFLGNLEHYLSCPMTFVKPEDARHKDFYSQDSRFGTFPIARVDDVEIAMLHYHSEEEAVQKWERRCKRVDREKLLVKMNDQNGCTEAHARAFLELPYKNKVFFTVNDWPGCVKLPGKDTVGMLAEPFGASRRYNVNKAIKGLKE